MRLIETNTLRLEPLVLAHAEEMFEPMSAPEIYEFIPEKPPASLSSLRQRYRQLERGRSADGRQLWLNWVVRLASGQCTGNVQATIYPGSTGDFAFVFAPKYWGRSVAFEACQAAVQYMAHELGVSALYATVDPRNSRSAHLLTRLGFTEVLPARYPHGEVEPNDQVFAMSCRPLSGEERIPIRRREVND